MKLTFHQQPEDLADLWEKNFKQQKWLRLLFLFVAIMILFNLIMDIVLNGLNLSILLNSLLPSLIIVGIWWFIFKRTKQRIPQDDPLIIGYREVELLEEGIRYKTDLSDAMFKWQAVTKLAESSKNYFLYLGKQRAVIIPKSALKTVQEHHDFLEMFKQYAEKVQFPIS